MIMNTNSWTVKGFALSCAAVAAMICTCGAGAQQKKDTAPTAAPAPQKQESRGRSTIRAIDDTTLPLSPGDVIQIIADNFPMLDTLQTVPGVGRLLLPEVGEIEISGKTAKQVQEKLQAAIDKNFNNITIHVLLKEMHSRKASVTGFVAHQGSLDMGTSEYRFLDLLDYAGGLVAPITRPYPKLNEYQVNLYRASAVVSLDIEDIVKHPDSAGNIVIQPGDRITFDLKPIAVHQIHILGQIPREGAFPIDSNTTVLSLFGMSGYPSTSAALSKAYVIRGSEKMPLDLRPLLTGSVDTSVNKFKFTDEDIIFIPESKLTFMVWGQVAKQGNFPFPEGGKVSLIEAINFAGQTAQTNYKNVHLIRSVDGKQTDKKIDVDKMMRDGKIAENLQLQPNDVVWVGPKGKKKWVPTLQELFLPISLINMLGLRPF
jgi:protein involved in polysaccharide export with SLBB domain